MVKHESETVLLSQKEDCHTILPDFGNDQFSARNNGERENISMPIDSYCFQTVKPLQSQYKKPIKKNTKTIIQKSAILNDTNNTEDDDPIRKKHATTMIPFSSVLSLTINPSIAEECNDSENEILKLQSIHETYSSVVKQSLNDLFFDPSFFKYISKIIELSLPPDTPLNIETILQYKRRYILSWGLYTNELMKNSVLLKKTPVINASPFLLEITDSS